MPRHFLNTQDWSIDGLQHLLTQASAFKAAKFGDQLKGRSIALLFFNPSLRTRTSFELGAFQLGAQIFDRMDAMVEISTEDDQNFRKNLVTVLAEERLALAVYRPEAFVKGDFAAAATAATAA